MSAWEILAPAFVASLLLIVTHTYLGLHVLARGVIFVDLALAQVALLGMAFGFLLGFEPHSTQAHALAFAAALVAAGGFALLRQVQDKVTREVAIGTVYVVATALAVVILSRTASGMEELKGMLNGNILWVQWREVASVAVAYGAVLALHAILRKRFLALSFASAPALAVRVTFLWEFLFFASFAVVITFALDIAGVLLVFAYLIIPAFSASLIARGLLRQWILGVGLSAAGTAAGLWLSYIGDLPTGATVVSTLGALPILTLAWRVWIRRT